MFVIIKTIEERVWGLLPSNQYKIWTMSISANFEEQHWEFESWSRWRITCSYQCICRVSYLYLQGHFIVKKNPGCFNAVAPDMKLEQTIQWSQKSSKGIIGQTHQVNYVSKWEVVYREILAISNAFRDLTKSKLGNRECELHHELYGNYSDNFNKQILKVTDFIRARGHPFSFHRQVKNAFRHH